MKILLQKTFLRLMEAHRIRLCYWITVVSLFLTTFTASCLMAPKILPSLLEYQIKHPRVKFVRPTPLIKIHGHDPSARDKFRVSTIIYRHNIKAALFNGLGSVFLFPLATLKATAYGFTLGLTAYVDGWRVFLLRILPHGILEFPIIWLIASRATMTGWRIFIVPWRKKLETLQKETVDFVLVWVVAAMLLFPSALLETFGRAIIQEKFF